MALLLQALIYYLVNVSGSTFQFSLTPGGSPIIPGDQGAGTEHPAMAAAKFQLDRDPDQHARFAILSLWGSLHGFDLGSQDGGYPIDGRGAVRF